MDKVTDQEFETHVFPTAEQNYESEHERAGRDLGWGPTWSDEQYAEIQEWARVLRDGYDDGSFDITWR